MVRFQSVADRIAKNAVPIPETGCWIYDGSTTKAGYAYMSVNGRLTFAHRASYELYKGAIPPGMFVCHSCDVPSCCNPDHLFVGTPADNSRDAVRKNRMSRKARITGSAVPFSKLSAEQVIEIRHQASSGVSRKEIARAFGVTVPAVGYIVRRNVWKHV